jgi:hypothetical protein
VFPSLRPQCISVCGPKFKRRYRVCYATVAGDWWSCGMARRMDGVCAGHQVYARHHVRTVPLHHMEGLWSAHQHCASEHAVVTACKYVMLTPQCSALCRVVYWGLVNKNSGISAATKQMLTNAGRADKHMYCVQDNTASQNCHQLAATQAQMCPRWGSPQPLCNNVHMPIAPARNAGSSTWHLLNALNVSVCNRRTANISTHTKPPGPDTELFLHRPTDTGVSIQ